MSKCSIIIKEKKNTASGHWVFTLTLRMKTWKFWEREAMQDILPKLITNFIDEGRICYLLFSVETLPAEMCDSVVSVDRARSAITLVSECLTVNQQDPKQIFMGYNDGIERHLLVLREEATKIIPSIVSLISCRDFTCYLIIDSEQNKDKLFAEIKKFSDRRSLDREKVLALSPEIIEYSLSNWLNQIIIHTQRFNLEQIKDIVRRSAGLNVYDIS